MSIFKDPYVYNARSITHNLMLNSFERNVFISYIKTLPLVGSKKIIYIQDKETNLAPAKLLKYTLVYAILFKAKERDYVMKFQIPLTGRLF